MPTTSGWNPKANLNCASMALTLEEYAEHLEKRPDLAWPAPPEVQPPKAKPCLVSLPEIRVVTWSVYGTLLAISGGELYLQHPQKFVMELALDKTLQEFKMWKAMTRKPGHPAAQLHLMYNNALSDLQLVAGNERHPDVDVAKVWESIVKKLLTNEYVFDTGFYGSLDDYARKIAYFFHASLQGTACYEGAAETLQDLQRILGRRGGCMGLLADGQCFTPVQLHRALLRQGLKTNWETLIPSPLRVLSYEVRAKKPSERLFREMLRRLKERGYEPREVLHVGSHLLHDVAPARKLGMRTALFAGDKASLHANGEQLRQPQSRPDVLLTELPQVLEVFA
ncbi:MAG: HAD family hydrolase [Gemmatales bacterium]|nr:HAD family hydrolase [Gemmatales bacterium]MDW8385777.1 HAD family hydrolase [Gemmatales bacterium]